MRAINSLLLKYRSNLIAVFSIILIGVALLDIYYSVEVRVKSNDECLWTSKKISEDSVGYFFDYVKVNGVTWKAGIRDGDRLLEINHIPIQTDFQAQAILNSFNEGQHAPYKYSRDGKVYTTKVYVKKLITFEYLASALSALFWILIGFIVLSAKPDGKIQKIFYSLAVLIVLNSMTVLIPFQDNFKQFFREDALLGIFIGLPWLIGICFSPFIVIYFFMNFPNPLKLIQKKWFRNSIFIIPVILIVFYIILAILTIREELIDEKTYFISLNLLEVLSTAANITAFVFLIIQYRKIKIKEEKKPLMIFIIAFIFASLITLYIRSIAPIISDTIFNSPEYYTPIILIALVPLIFAYAIFKYQLMDVSIVIRNTIVYGTATVTVAAIYFFVIYVAGKSISSFFGVENQGIIAGVFFIVFAFVFQSTKDRFQDFLTRKFYPEQFAHQQVLIDLSNELAIVAGLDNILSLMKKTFTDALRIKTFGMMISDKDGNLNLVDSVGMIHTNCKITESHIIPFIKEKILTTKYPAIERTDFNTVLPNDKAVKLLEEKIHTIVPMMAKGKLVGLLLFGLKHSGSQFAGKDLELLWAAANQAAISIENARLYKSEVEKQKIERDLDLARKIQQGLLPRTIPNVKGLDICGQMIPAMQVGGDYFDLIKVSDSKIFVVVGDVSGKGLSASLYMAKLQTMIQLSCTADKTPKQILVEINKKLYDSLERSCFITMTLALFNSEMDLVTFCRAGHMPLLTAKNDVVNSYKSKGIGIGLESGRIFESSLVEEEVKLNSGQIFAFFSDGITEAMNERNDLFGEDNLSELLKQKSHRTSNELMNEIWEAIIGFRGNANQNDDMTMVLVKVK